MDGAAMMVTWEELMDMLDEIATEDHTFFGFAWFVAENLDLTAAALYEKRLIQWITETPWFLHLIYNTPLYRDLYEALEEQDKESDEARLYPLIALGDRLGWWSVPRDYGYVDRERGKLYLEEGLPQPISNALGDMYGAPPSWGVPEDEPEEEPFDFDFDSTVERWIRAQA